MNRTGLLIALVIAAGVGLVFGIWPDLDLKLAALFYDPVRGFWRAYDPIYLRARDVAVWLVTLVAVPRARLRDGPRLRRRRRNFAHGSRRAFLHGLGVRGPVQFSGDLVRARMALPLAAHADLGRGGGTRARADRGKANLTAARINTVPWALGRA